ncbi:MAG: Major Facilitator Superfamily protein [Methanosaeta sp. PtaU1.Bin060]|nr:MAG: Major Facilitator Superfamily protein [Methanosaeta sp. PtaU1.Bin060]
MAEEAKESGSRWVLVIDGLIIMLCLGAIYAYSIISVPLKAYYTSTGLTPTAVDMQIPFIVFLAFFALTMPLIGKYIEQYGPRKVGMVGGVLVGLGWFLASFASTPMMLAVLYGGIGGIGVGVAYNCPITVSGRWFPDKRGLAVGLTVLGFGFSAALIGPIADSLTSSYGILTAMKIFGVAFLIIIVALSTLLRFPPAGWKPAEWAPPAPKAGATAACDFYRKDMLKTTSCWGLWLCYIIGATAGLMAIGIAKPAGLEVAGKLGMDPVTSSALMTSLVIPFAVANGFGRPIFGSLVDKMGARNTAFFSFVLIFIASVMMAGYLGVPSIAMYTIAFILLWACLGGWLAIAPSCTGAYFGMKDYACNYGFIFTAYGLGAIIGNILASSIKDITGSYAGAFPIVAVLAIVGIIIAFVMLKPPAAPS